MVNFRKLDPVDRSVKKVRKLDLNQLLSVSRLMLYQMSYFCIGAAVPGQAYES